MTLDDVLTSGEGCKNAEKITKFHDRSAGMIYIFRPCGSRLTHCEMLSHESLTQVFMSLVHFLGSSQQGNYCVELCMIEAAI